jgi:hypothetical protein
LFSRLRGFACSKSSAVARICEDTIIPVIAAELLGRNPVLFDTFDGSKELDSGLKPAGET